MKRILITGASGYIGSHMVQFLAAYNEKQENRYRVDTLSLRGEEWLSYDFTAYDAVLHLAGKAHADITRLTPDGQQAYYDINCDLAVRVAKKAKEAGVSQFIYMSSVIVYGAQSHITAHTLPAPATFYGDSKWKGEQEVQKLASVTPAFHVALVRCPMVYGKGSKGNFPMLIKLARRVPVFPAIQSERSVIYIENLTEFLRRLLESGQGGVYLPQNTSYVTTPQLVQAIGKQLGKRIFLSPLLNPFIWIMGRFPGKIGGMVQKAFGSLKIEPGLTGTITGYQLYSLEESIQRTICG